MVCAFFVVVWEDLVVFLLLLELTLGHLPRCERIPELAAQSRDFFAHFFGLVFLVIEVMVFLWLLLVDWMVVGWLVGWF